MLDSMKAAKALGSRAEWLSCVNECPHSANGSPCGNCPFCLAVFPFVSAAVSHRTAADLFGSDLLYDPEMRHPLHGLLSDDGNSSGPSREEISAAVAILARREATRDAPLVMYVSGLSKKT